jgi:hypothetical protein
MAVTGVVIPGLTAMVSVTAPAGCPAVSGSAARVAVTAPMGDVVVSAPAMVATINVVAVMGTLSTSDTAVAGCVQVCAPNGTVSVSTHALNKILVQQGMMEEEVLVTAQVTVTAPMTSVPGVRVTSQSQANTLATVEATQASAWDMAAIIYLRQWLAYGRAITVQREVSAGDL